MSEVNRDREKEGIQERKGKERKGKEKRFFPICFVKCFFSLNICILGDWELNFVMCRGRKKSWEKVVRLRQGKRRWLLLLFIVLRGNKVESVDVPVTSCSEILYFIFILLWVV